MNAIIIDDELMNRESLKVLLQEYCPDIHVAGMAESVKEGKKLLRKIDVDVVFLDIIMPGESGFELLSFIPKNSYSIIFVTAFSEYALKALKASAVDYLLKPIDIEDLKLAVKKARELQELRKRHVGTDTTYRQIMQKLSLDLDEQKPITQLTVMQAHGFRVVDLKDIVHVEADGNYCILHMVSMEKLITNRPIKDLEELLDSSQFRAHKSALINLKYLKGYTNTVGSLALMQDGSKVMVSRRRLSDFMNMIERLSLKI